ncbi:aromatic ring-hydroxylating dioxygenase subunit alpha [Aquisediminimonas profunda]|uniref:aromatic ring-hydroxylating dioxygenase subunit alpha n=1 Tax=Aquisediminimonas profunda TaxID=1550733 RepID=UPI001C63AE4D|nr:aromatic ring-hydroxylating dioxygenase subunit alpha [Aquisediminimonas profunda]
MPFVNEAWYVGAWSEALTGDTVLARTIVGKMLVLYRTPDGEIVVLEDRCPHRLAPLSRGRVDGDRIVCGYHGLEFGRDGICAYNPHGARIPPRARVRRFAACERHGAIWIWLGNGEPDTAQIPDFSILDGATGAAALRRDHLLMAAPWDLITDNLLDLSHVNFLHEGILGNAEMIEAKNVIELNCGTVTVSRRSAGVTPPEMFDMLFRQDGAGVDSWMSMRWDAPAALLLDVGVTGVGEPREAGTGYFGVHILTPETERTTHYHFAAVRWNIRPGSDTAEMKEKISDLRRFAFAEQDMPMIAAQASVWEKIGRDNFRPVWLDIDIGVARWRKIVEDRLAAEAQHSILGEVGAA